MTVAVLAILGLVILFGLAMLAAVTKSGHSRSRRTGRLRSTQPGLNKAQFQLQWQRVEELMRMPGTDSTKSAIFEADKLLDIALRQNGFRGETMGERLKSAREHFHNNAIYQGMWDAHKMRNALAHELSFELPAVVAQEQLEKFKAGLHYLQAL
jgi:hypothetical protein